MPKSDDLGTGLPPRAMPPPEAKSCSGTIVDDDVYIHHGLLLDFVHHRDPQALVLYGPGFCDWGVKGKLKARIDELLKVNGEILKENGELRGKLVEINKIGGKLARSWRDQYGAWEVSKDCLNNMRDVLSKGPR